MNLRHRRAFCGAFLRNDAGETDMKKKDICEAVVERSIFPDTGIVTVEDRAVQIKHTLPGQKIRFRITKIRKSGCKGELLEVLHPSPDEVTPMCPHFAACGGCAYQNLPYEKQLALLEKQVHDVLKNVVPEEAFLPIKGSPRVFGYRNKMEFTFGDEKKDGPLVLGLHKRGSFYDLTQVYGCQIMDEDFRAIVSFTESFFRKEGISFYHRKRHEGYLRHLLVRKGTKSEEILVDLVTVSELPKEDGTDAKALLARWCEGLCELSLEGKLVGVLHTVNDGVADTIADEGTSVLYGTDFFEEQLLRLTFTITPFSFFQTNSLGAEVLYETVRDYVGDTDGKNIYDLYSGTGTIAQVLAPVAKHVTGVEIVPEAVSAARENAKKNNLNNCTFLAGDVLKVLDDIPEKPDVIILDPPRDGINPKALSKIVAYGVDTIVYISCKPTSLARDLVYFEGNGYEVKKCVPIDLFPAASHVESVVGLKRVGDEA